MSEQYIYLFGKQIMSQHRFTQNNLLNRDLINKYLEKIELSTKSDYTRQTIHQIINDEQEDNLSGLQFNGENFNGIRFKKNIERCLFIDCNMTNSLIHGSCDGAAFINLKFNRLINKPMTIVTDSGRNMNNTLWFNIKLINVHFYDYTYFKSSEFFFCSFDDIKHKKYIYKNSIFCNCTFRNCDLSYANFKNAQFYDCLMEKVDFSESNFENAKLYGCSITDCKLPENINLTI
jgi:uncharacterized protein YjbI with pentapeptide repeats